MIGSATAGGSIGGADVTRVSAQTQLLRRAFYFALRQLERYLRIHIVWIAGSDLRPPNEQPKLPDGLTLRLLRDHPQIEALASKTEGLSASFVRTAFARGDIAAGVLSNDKLVAYVWRTFSAAPHSHGVWIRVRPPTVYGYKAFTHSAYRGRRLSAAITHELDRACLRRAAARRVAIVALYNESSKRAEHHRGSRSLGYAAFCNWGRCRFTLHTAGIRRLGFELFWPSSNPMKQTKAQVLQG